MTSNLSSFPWGGAALTACALIGIFIYGQVIAVGVAVARAMWRLRSAREMRDTAIVLALSLLFIVLQLHRVTQGPPSDGGDLRELLWYAFDAGVGLLFLHHLTVRRRFMAADWGSKTRDKV